MQLDSEDLSLKAAPLVMGGIEIGLAVAAGLLKRGVLPEALKSACTDPICQAIFDYVVDVLTANDDPWDFELLLDSIECAVERSRCHLLQ